MQSRDLEPSPRAKSSTLLRRVYLDLIGIPPTAAQAKAFIDDDNSAKFELLVDDLMASRHFGEHWSSFWLDLARYADSFGYSADINRVIWKYRDWVIQALNQDMPFDQFTTEQLAGDLLPSATNEQLIATAFHRACLTNGEGGADLEENRNSSVIDRVNTTWETWQATTMSCVQCHDHPYDPFKQTDYYRSFAFFNNTNDHTLREDFPVLRTFSEEDRDKLERVKEWIRKYGDKEVTEKTERLLLTHEPKIVPFDFVESTKTKFYNRIGDDYMSAYNGSSIHLGRFDLQGVDKLIFHYKSRDIDGRIRIHFDNTESPEAGSAILKGTKGRFRLVVIPFEKVAKTEEVFLTFHSNEEDAFEVFIEGVMLGPEIPGAKELGYLSISENLSEILQAKAEVTTPIMSERPENLRRETHVFERGNWLTKGNKVEPGLADIFNYDSSSLQSRLDFARWLVSDRNPLTARVMVNRIWAQLFGQGIVSTLEDFGSMGDLPSHPKLLDWLAIHFSKDQGWHLKKLIKKIVLSATYQQSSEVTTKALKKDPNNRWLSRSPRVRLSAEQVRDQALLTSGLLSYKMYGPGVMPVQPEGIWKVSFSNDKWITSEGEDRYRRAIYTFLKRSALYPSFLTFDASGREVCLSRRIPTNTPLQALVTLNDPVYFEAALQIAKQLVALPGSQVEVLSEAYFKVIGKHPSHEKVEVLKTLYTDSKNYYGEYPAEIEKMTGTKNIKLALYTVVVNSLMNMDEFITRN